MDSRIVAVLALAAASAAQAQNFPTKPVAMVVPFAAGGPTDTLARNLGIAMGKALKQTVLVENLAGAAGNIAAARVSRASPDGYYILIHHIGMSTSPTLYRKLNYDPLTDFEYIGLVADVPMTLIARGDFPAKDFKEFLAYIKANKDKMNYANAGIGAASHLCGLLFMSTIQTAFTTVPYTGTGPAMNALLGGQVDFMCDQTTNTTGPIRSGKVKVFGVTSAKRVASLPNVPTLQEQGLKGFEVGIWHGLYAPKKTPQASVNALASALQVALRDPDLIKNLANLGTEPVAKDKATPAALHAHLKAEIAKWAPVIKAAGQYAD
ncbi:MAG: tripartite tricarboxylate transporter substrate binding protein BugD [Burkholderiales bacterium]|nr:tripartite tricarboxylate transporter substrate binding protein BugD [Burkholderiales bacterium]